MVIKFPAWVKGPTTCTQRTFSVVRKSKHGVVRIELIMKPSLPIETVRDRRGLYSRIKSGKHQLKYAEKRT